MVVTALDFRRVQPFSAADNQSVRQFGNVGARRRQRRRHRAEPVALLDAQPRRARDAALAFGRRHRHGQNRHKIGNLCAIHAQTVQLRRAGDERFSLPADLRAHVAQNFDHRAVALRAVRVKPGQADFAAPDCPRRQIKRRMAPIALDMQISGRHDPLSAGDKKHLPIRPPFADHAEIALHFARQFHIRAGFQRRGDDDFAVAREPRQGEQQPGDKLAAHVAGQFKPPALQRALHRQRVALLIP